MSQPSVIVLRAAGINCEVEMAYGFSRFDSQVDTVHVNRLLADPEQLLRHHVLALPGGFAYGDDVAAGAVMATEMSTRLGDVLTRFIEQGGLVFGICNGFQALVRLGLLPGLRQTYGVQEVSLTDNLSHKYEDRWVRLGVIPGRCVFVRDETELELPVGHAEGRLVCLDEDVRRRLHDEQRVVFRYLSADGAPSDRYPSNPNGSLDAIAGLTDSTGRVLGMMPHPDRALFGHNHPEWTRHHRGSGAPELGPGASLFANACDWVRENR